MNSSKACCPSSPEKNFCFLFLQPKFIILCGFISEQRYIKLGTEKTQVAISSANSGIDVFCFPEWALSFLFFFPHNDLCSKFFCILLIINADSNDGMVKLRFTGTQFCKASMAIS